VPSSPAVRLPVLAALFACGVVLGLVGVGVVSLESTIGSATLPWGVVLAVLGVACSVRGAAWLVGSRRGGMAVLLGWFVPTFAFSAVNPGGDVVLTDEPRTYVYLLTTFALGLAGATWPLPEGAAELGVTHPRPHPDPDDELDVDEAGSPAVPAVPAVPAGAPGALDLPVPRDDVVPGSAVERD
jgi:Family of unknown function (DUF6113)